MVPAKRLFQPASLLSPAAALIVGLAMPVLFSCQSAPPPPPPPDFSDITCGTDKLVEKLQADPPSLSGCSPASIRAAEMPALIDAGVTKEQLLAVWSLDGATGFTPLQLKDASITVAQMKSAGLTVSEMYTGGISVADLRMAEVSIADLRSVGVTIHKLHSGGFTIDQMRGAGLTISQIHAGGVSISDLTSAGLTLLQLYNGGISTAQLRSAGATVAEMRMDGLSIFQMYVGGVSTAQLKEAGLTIAQMQSAGLTLSQIHTGGVSIADLHSAGVSIADLRSAGISIADLRTGIADHLVFNEACNTPESGDPEFTAITDGPMITSVSLELDPDDNTYAVVLEGRAGGSIQWLFSGSSDDIEFILVFDSPGVTTMRGGATAVYLRNEGGDGTTIVSTWSIPLVDDDDNINNNIFSNPTVTVVDNRSMRTSIDLCPCASDDPPDSAMCP